MLYLIGCETKKEVVRILVIFEDRLVFRHINKCLGESFPLMWLTDHRSILKNNQNTVQILYNEQSDITSKFGAEVWSRIHIHTTNIGYNEIVYNEKPVMTRRFSRSCRFCYRIY